MQRARPRPGAYLDVLALGGDDAVAIRRERGSERAFVEMIAGARVRWQALVPRYAGISPNAISGVGLAASANAVTVRVIRDGQPELFALSTGDAGKLGSLHLASDRPKSPTGHTLPAAITLHDGARSYELLGEEGDWTRVAAFDLATGTIAWVRDLDGEPVREARVIGDRVRLWRVSSVVELATRDGAVSHGVASPGPAEADDRALPVLALDAGARRLAGGDLTGAYVVRQGPQWIVVAPRARVAVSVDAATAAITAQVRWPPDALAPRQHHLAEGALWIVRPDGLVAVDPASLQPRVGIGTATSPLEKATVFQLVGTKESSEIPGR